MIAKEHRVENQSPHPRLGYLVPEFPGQTHIFFWRELQELAREGVDVSLISTRRPSARIISHSWSEKAMAETVYLNQLDFSALLAMIRETFRAGPGGVFRLLKSVLESERGTNSLQRLIGLGLMGIRLSAIARDRGLSHVHVHSCGNAANVALFANRFSGLRYSLTLHGPLRDYGDNQALKWRHSNFSVVITENLREEVNRELAGNLPAQVAVCPMGVDLGRFSRSLPLPVWKDGAPLSIFSCGRLNRCKGHDDLIKVVASLRAKGIFADLSIAGADDAEGSYRSYLEKLIQDLDLGASVHLLGAVREDVIIEHLQSCHVFALASLEEPLGVAIMEAMAMEVPVVATRAGGVPELVEEGVHGLLVPPEDPPALEEAILRIVRHPELASQMGREAKKRVAELFGSARSATVLKKLFLQS